MINKVRNTVLAILNKENRGWITPEEFNLFCYMAQLEIFEDYFYEYNRWLTKQNLRQSHSEYADMPAILREKIDIFSTEVDFADLVSIGDPFVVPETVYRVTDVLYNNTLVDEVQKKEIKRLLNSNLTEPTTDHPVYFRMDNNVYLYPTSITSGVSCYCLRKPLEPKWTYTEVSGDPIFNPSANDYQDLEIHPSDETELIIRVLAYAGVSIRENDIYEIANREEAEDFQTENNL